MSDIVTLLDALYSRFILRDIFGKVIPGSIVLIALGVSVYGPSETLRIVGSMNFGFWILATGAAWISAFSVQALGEHLGFIRYHNPSWSDEEYYSRRMRFYAVAGEREKQQLERFIVIKEACGNGYLSASLALALLAIDRVVDAGGFRVISVMLKDSWHINSFIVGIVVYLARMHFIHVSRQSTYLSTVINVRESILPGSSPNNTIEPTR